MRTLEDLFLHGLKELYYGESQLLEALPSLRDAARKKSLKEVFEMHLREKQSQRNRLERIYKKLGISSSGVTSPGMQGMIAELHHILQEADPDEVQDARLIGAAKKIAHYEIAGYSNCVRYAKKLQHIETARKLQETLDEAYARNTLLDQVAEDRLLDQVA